jgi:hypothetical protein
MRFTTSSELGVTKDILEIFIYNFVHKGAPKAILEAERVRRVTFSGKKDPLFYCAKPICLAQKSDRNNKKRRVETAREVTFLTRSATYGYSYIVDSRSWDPDPEQM